MMHFTHRRYLSCFALFFIGGLLLILLLTVLMDVYQVFGTPALPGVNQVRHGMDRHARIAKAYAVRQFKPEVVLLGSSRAESAFDPMHPMFAGKRTYNLALTGASVYELYRYLQHATAGGQLKQAVVAIDYFQFLRPTQWVSEDFSEQRLAVTVDGQEAAFPWQDLALLSLSGAAIKESWWSLTHQKSKPSIYRADGFRDDRYDIPEMLGKPGGQREEFNKSEAGYLGAYLRQRQVLNTMRLVVRDPYEDIRLMRAWAVAHGIDLILVVPPVHARHLELIYRLGAWPEFENWRRRLVALPSVGKTGTDCLWDFSGYNGITEEVLPSSSGQSMQWWRESSHATSAAGRKILDVLYDPDAPKNMPNYGRCVTASNVETVLDKLQRQRADWVALHPVDVKEVQMTIRRFERRNKKDVQ